MDFGAMMMTSRASDQKESEHVIALRVYSYVIHKLFLAETLLRHCCPCVPNRWNILHVGIKPIKFLRSILPLDLYCIPNIDLSDHAERHQIGRNQQ